jgi:protease-4
MNDVRRRGPVARFFVGLWDTVNFTRRLVFNLLFLLLLVLVIAAIGAGERAAPLLERTTLVLAPEGRLVEQYSLDPATRALNRTLGENAGEVQLRDLVRALDAARTDTRIERIVLDLDGLQADGMASLREVANAVARVRAAGKPVVAFSEMMDQKQYLLAAQANEVFLDPMGGMLLEGLARYRLYYREALEDKLGVDMHLFKVGEFKSAAEPYVLDSASPEAKQADLYWMNDVWQRYLADVAKARKLDPQWLATRVQSLPAEVQAANGDLAQYALQHKLVDALKTRGELNELLTERGVADADADSGFRQVTLDGYLAHLDRGINAADTRPQVAIVVAEGEITGGEQPPGTIGGESTAALLRDALDDENVKTVVLRVDSPGGEVFASEQIRREVVALKAAGKPVVVSMGDLAASGGYWISMNADRIYADPSTITGSIGIFGLIPTFPRTLDKLGIHADGVSTTGIAGAFDVTRPLDPAVGAVIQSVIEKGYRDFTGKVAEARGREIAQVDAVARGRVWSGAQALERGLVDELGGLQAAVDHAAARAKLGKADAWRVRYVEQPATPFERFFAGFASSRIGQAWLRDSDLARGLVARMLPQAAGDLAFLERTLRERRAGTPVTALSHCFCGF